MQQIISFLYKNKLFILFLLLEILAITFTIQTHSYHKSKFVNSANFLSGGIYNRINNFKEFLLLKKENERLNEENVYLKNLLNLQEKEIIQHDLTSIDSLKFKRKYSYTGAKVINNNFRKNNNYLTIDKGSNQGINSDLGVINSKGIIGITKSISGNYATVLSILNVNSRINAKLLNSDHYGSLSWDNNDYNVVQLLDLPIQAAIYKGDTVVTGGKSTIFPEGIPIGTIKEFKTVNNNYEFINVQLFNDMSSIGFVQVIKNFDKIEIKTLEEKSANE
ncbi:rod shape-determining protein MreC [Lutimonas saemankumensis]|uniref:rod shape-determining protein MreC n=1 Tax=Lutimonas saemankumensis TaxID=483016 RepID=UPI001CD3D663|nr:rod shape-determining protein MreC [Lutimonas saemankumensis]MCA0930941.1 rod shape-determining protein MreC [Lutimonas saemankumensis]